MKPEYFLFKLLRKMTYFALRVRSASYCVTFVHNALNDLSTKNVLNFTSAFAFSYITLNMV